MDLPTCLPTYLRNGERIIAIFMRDYLTGSGQDASKNASKFRYFLMTPMGNYSSLELRVKAGPDIDSVHDSLGFCLPSVTIHFNTSGVSMRLVPKC